jgi:hypothetical protein
VRGFSTVLTGLISVPFPINDHTRSNIITKMDTVCTCIVVLSTSFNIDRSLEYRVAMYWEETYYSKGNRNFLASGPFNVV